MFRYNMKNAKKDPIVTTSPPTEIKLLLQKGIASARSGRSDEARQILQQVIEADPSNEMAWLWLSGLMTTNQQKRACLEQVLEANPENVYARAGLARLPDEPCIAEDELEARLASVTASNVSSASIAASMDAMDLEVQPKLKRLKSPPPSNGRSKNRKNGMKRANGHATSDPSASPDLFESDSTPLPSPAELRCPACDEPISPKAKMCPYCFMPFKSLDELLGRDDQSVDGAAASSSRRKRKGILGHLGL
jgi:type II secretory pathway component HofQ